MNAWLKETLRTACTGRVLKGSFLLSLLLLFCMLTASSAVVPPDVVSAEKSLGKWVNGFKGKSETDLVKELGPPSERTTWDFSNTKPPLLHFARPRGAKISFYFYEGRVVTVSYHLMSE